MFEVTSITVNGRETSNWREAADAMRAMMNNAMQEGTIAAGIAMEMTMTRIKSNLLERHSGNWPLSGNEWGTVPDRLAMRTGRGLDSVFRSARVNIGTGRDMVTGRISTARLTVHETGATIRPVRGKYLAIPMRSALDSHGVPLRSGPRSWDNTFVARSRRGNLIIFRRDGNTVQPLYLLAKQAVIPPRLRLGETVDANMPYFQNKVLQAFEREFLS